MSARFLASCTAVLLLLQVFSPIHASTLPAVYHDNVAYVSLNALAQIPGVALAHAPQKHKTTLRIGRQRVTFIRLSSLIAIDSETYRLPYKTRYINGTLHIPAVSLELLTKRIGRDFNVSKQRLVQAKPMAASPTPSPLQTSKPPPRKQLPRASVKTKPEDQTEDWTLTTVVIDPGHGGKDPGALGHSGTHEKTIALDVGKQLAKLLTKHLKVDVVLTRDDDTFIPLRQRSQIALQKGGKIFISLHCNATKNQKARGVEVYFLSEAKTKAAAEVAEKENAAIQYEEDPSEYDEILTRIEARLLSHQFLKESQTLAADIHDAIVDRVPNIQKRGVKQANFYVMRGTMAKMPSVLVELGFITNATEEKQLKTSRHQRRLAEGLYRGIKAFKERYEQQFSTNN